MNRKALILLVIFVSLLATIQAIVLILMMNPILGIRDVLAGYPTPSDSFLQIRTTACFLAALPLIVGSIISYLIYHSQNKDQ